MRVVVSAPSRIHLTLVDLHGSLSGRVDGGVGFSLDEPRFVVSAERATQGADVDISGGDEEDRSEGRTEILGLLQRMSEAFKLPSVNVSVSSTYGSHAGLGSKTAILLAVCQAYLNLFERELPAPEMGRLVRRGGTSCIGSHGFHSGGLIVDCGHSFAAKGGTFRISGFARDIPPGPLVGRYAMPDWPILLVTPNARKIHGKIEQEFFESVCPIPLADVRVVCHAIMMMLIPAAIEDDVDTFGRGMGILQTCKWKSHQISCQGAIVKEVMERLTELGLTGVGMSSWGSSIVATGAVLNDKEQYRRVVKEIQDLMDSQNGGTCLLTRATNAGRRVKFE
ncbi:beta-ribofuranosylaminobenzene 5'-phosphate synthase family protein [Mesorhizobium captivum]|uniref:beta-ribofuranosylaminobenzene 5'-phosphate synthase family protein n=1 Tax=Mesorhizobium captivum TaxID=3072319 RepID=UPI002A24346E|nr:beta-ribofuranosylaminobenzene 5'-phosphate synthase family protein [Mesorhizobium sp. VK3C]MDX8450483.1 hypothetical protein [Mesorhizobium sp. VK3C]